MFWIRRRRAGAHPVFVGGSGRSGTTALARLLAQHSRYSLISTEARFHCEDIGLPGFLEGQLTAKQLGHRLLEHYYRRPTVDGSTRGLHLAGVEHDDMRSAVHRFERVAEQDPTRASEELIHAIFDPVAESHGADTWVEMTPPNAEYADVLTQILPGANVVHIVRDGRDVAASVVKHTWGPDDHLSALRWWDERPRAAEEAARRARGSVHVVSFERLMVTDRIKEYKRLLRRLRLRDEPAMRQFFEQSLTPERAHVGRWEHEVPDDQRPAFEALYQDLLNKMAEDGITCALLTVASAA